MRFALWFVLVPVLFAQTTGIVEGTVVDSITKQPIPGVSVTLRNSSKPELAYQATSDGKGVFRITGMQEGAYRSGCVECEKEGYTPFQSGPQIATPPLVVTHLEPLRVHFELIPLGKLRGRVMDGEGRSVRDATIIMAALAGGSATGAGNVKTDAEGRFLIEGVYPGIFTLQANPGKNLKPPASAPGEERMAWVITYFPNATRRNEAQHITVRAGADMDGFVIRLRAAPVHRVSGVVLDENSKPAAGVPVRLIIPDYWSGNYGVEARVNSGEGGAFEFPAVSERDWHLAAEIKRDKTTLKGFASVLVQRLDVEGLVIRLAAPFTMNVAVEWKDAPKDGPQRANVALRPDGDTAAENIYGTQQDDGTVRLEDVYSGTYRVDAYGYKAQGYHLASVLFAGEERFGQPVDIINASLPLRLIFEQGNGSIRGTIENCGNAEVALWAADTATRDSYFRLTACDPAGHFEFADLHPGEYYAAAFAAVVDRYQLQTPDFLRLVMSQSAHVRVEKGSMVSIDLKPIPWPE
jgi:hypothetical protein